MAPVTLSEFAKNLNVETAFTVLAVAKALKARGKDVVELQIGDSPFPSTALGQGRRRSRRSSDEPVALLPVAGPAGVPRGGGASSCARSSASRPAAENVVVGPGAKVFEQFFCEAFLDPGDGVLVFSPHFPTYRARTSSAAAARAVSSAAAAGERVPPRPRTTSSSFLESDPQPKAIFLNSPHNPTGGVATDDDLKAIADLVRGTNIAVFSDEPYCHMVWKGRHRLAARRSRACSTRRWRRTRSASRTA